ncbi:MAG TPA: CBS and ACT domain-containing protein [Methylomirabilota bacterium]|jgi:acetoin utilization protein AcuB|nr:CBS and ACT domain-containing protein [Methylomirabilota bacterium]
MRVADVMQSKIVTISSQTTVPVAERLMHEHGVHHLPVVDNGLLLGIVSARDLARALPSPATSLARHEVTSLLDRVTAKEIMSRPVIVVEPSRTLEDAVRLLRVEGISALAVTDAGRLVGLLTEADVLDAFLATMRAAEPSSRIDVTVPDYPGGLADVIGVVEEAGVPIAQLTTVTPPDGRRRAIVQLATIDPRRAVAALETGGYAVGDRGSEVEDRYAEDRCAGVWP